MYTRPGWICTWTFLLLFSPLAPLAPLLGSLQLNWNPPCCDRIHPLRSQVAHKLTPLFPSPGSYTPLSKLPTPQGFPDLNIHSLGRHCKLNPQSSLTGMAIWESDSVDCSQTVVHSVEDSWMYMYTNQTNVLEGSTAVVDWSYDKRCFISAG